ncbi:helix-hairpin-helix domain-containing protein [Phycisphaeraceae bacterium D3-23]
MPIPCTQLAIAVFTLAMLLSTVLVGAVRSTPIDQLEREPMSLLIEANHADVDTLCLLPEVGPSIARKLIAYRESQGPLRTPDDLEAVSGIGPKKRAAIEPWVVFNQ